MVRPVGSLFDDVASALSKGAKDIASDPGVKAKAFSQVMEMTTGIPAIIDSKSEPGVVWVRLKPEHAEYFDSLVSKQVKKIGTGPSAGKPANFKVDVMPAAWPLILGRVVPVVALLVGVGVAAGYMYGRRR